MADPFTPRPDQPGQPEQPQIPMTVSFRPDNMSRRWVATAVEGALSLGLPDPDACMFGIDQGTGAPEVLLKFDDHDPAVWDQLTQWASRHEAEVVAAPATERPGHYYASAVFTRNFLVWTIAAYIPAATPGPAQASD
jgi:hypothetical protein